MYKQQQAAVATEGSKETRFFEGAPAKFWNAPLSRLCVLQDIAILPVS